MFHFVDFVTKKRVTPTNLIFTGKQNPWEVCINLEHIKKNLDLTAFKAEPIHLTKYMPFLPFANIPGFLRWQENPTPLIKSTHIGPELGVDLYFKVEGKNPTGSFKDRGSALEMNAAKHFKAKKIIVASTGNMAASCACYAALAEIPCQVLVPKGIPKEKLAQVLAFGGQLKETEGTYNEIAHLAMRIAEEKNYYLAGDYAFRVEGQKTAFFELVDQLHFHVPDQIIVPIGCGTNIAAYYKGIKEYHYLDLIQRLPQLIGVQAKGANPVIRSFQHGLMHVEPLTSINTIASAIAVGNPLDGLKALEAIDKTKGYATDVTDSAILEARHLLSAHEGLFVESAAAATVASLFKLKKEDRLKKK